MKNFVNRAQRALFPIAPPRKTILNRKLRRLRKIVCEWFVSNALFFESRITRITQIYL